MYGAIGWFVALGLLVAQPAMATLASATSGAAGEIADVSTDSLNCQQEKKEKRQACEKCKSALEQEKKSVTQARDAAVRESSALEASGKGAISGIGSGATGDQSNSGSSQDSTGKLNSSAAENFRQRAAIANQLATRAGQCPSTVEESCQDPGDQAKQLADQLKKGCQDLASSSSAEGKNQKAGKDQARTNAGKASGNNNIGGSLNKEADKTQGQGGASDKQDEKGGGSGGGQQGGGGGGQQPQGQQNQQQQCPQGQNCQQNQAADCNNPANAGLQACVQYKQQLDAYKNCLNQNAVKDVIANTCLNSNYNLNKAECVQHAMQPLGNPPPFTVDLNAGPGQASLQEPQCIPGQ
jgi:hypothetical protein